VLVLSFTVSRHLFSSRAILFRLIFDGPTNRCSICHPVLKWCFCLAVSYVRKFWVCATAPPQPSWTTRGISVETPLRKWGSISGGSRKQSKTGKGGLVPFYCFAKYRFWFSLTYFFLFKEGIVYVTSDWARIYFMSFYIVTMVSHDCFNLFPRPAPVSCDQTLDPHEK